MRQNEALRRLRQAEEALEALYQFGPEGLSLDDKMMAFVTVEGYLEEMKALWEEQAELEALESEQEISEAGQPVSTGLYL